MRLKLFAILAMAGLASVQAQDITISSNADWKTFIGSTSANAKANVKLAADITIDDYFRGTFSGTLDGQGHTITLPGNLTQDFAPIGTAGAGAVFKNLNIVGDVTTNKQLSGVAWKIAGATTIENVDVNLKVNSSAILTGGYIVNCEGMTTFKNCHSTVNLYVPGNIEANFSAFICKVNNNGSFRFENCSTAGLINVDGGWRAGGFVSTDYGIGEGTFINCISSCDVLQKNGTRRSGGFVGNPENNRSYALTNCLQTGKVQHLDNGVMVNNANPIICYAYKTPNYTTTNCYYTTGTGFPEGANTLLFARMDDSALTSGALCYALNGNQSQINFYQTLVEDAAPVLDPTHKQVFASGRKHCDGSDYAGVEYNNVSGETTQDEHNYVDNVCNYCGDLAIAADGYFHVVSPTSWAGFAAKLSKGITNINVKLDTDLTITQMLAGNYNATFDGQGHTITADLNAGGNEGGIFGIVSGGTYKNIVAEGTIRNASQAGFIGKLSAGTATIENVIVKMDIEGTANVAGLVGTCDGKTINFKNVIFAGKAKYVGVENGNGTGGFLGWAGSCTFNLENCAMIGDVDISGQPQKSAQFIRANNGCTFNMKNCAYIPAPGLMYVNGHNAEANANATIVENATDGKLCYLLNGDQTKINFYQTLGEDNIPTINSTHKQVYASGLKHCDGTDYEDMSYNNVSGESVTDEHNYVDNVCDYCHDLCIAADGYFHITNAAGWDAFIGNASANANVKVKLETDITIDEIKDCFIGTFSGTLDGQGHTITYDVDATSSDGIALFRKTDGAVVKNLNIGGSIKFTGDRAAGLVLSSGKTTIENVKNSANITADANFVSGFISNCKSGALIAKNCEYSGNLKCTKNAAVDCGGFIGKVENIGSFSFTDCVFSGEVRLETESGTGAAGWGAGGFVGKADGNITAIADCYFTDCAVTGEILQCNGAERAGGFIGSPQSDKLSYITKGCLMAGKAMRWMSNDNPTWEAQEKNVIFGCNHWKTLGSNTSAKDCYFTSNTGVNLSSVNGFTLVDHSLMATGALCYMLNGDQSDIHWYQTLGDDAAPTLKANHGIVSKMTAAGYATLYNAETAGTLSDNVEVYTGNVKGEWLTMTKQQNSIPAATAVVLKGSEGYYSFTPAASAPDITGTNDLKGAATNVDGEGKYILADGENGVCFYRATGTIPAGKVYLESAAEIKGFVFDDNATGIDNITHNPQPTTLNPVYNLAGQRMNKVQKGINIIGGKKVLK